MLYWIGKREIDIAASKDLFAASFTYWGSGKKGNHTLRNLPYPRKSIEYYRALSDLMITTIENDPHATFMFYSSSTANRICSMNRDLESRVLCRNPSTIVNWLNNKALSRLWASNYCEIPPSSFLMAEDCNFDDLRKRFPGSKSFVIQLNMSSGGNGTFLIDAESRCSDILLPGHTYLVSPCQPTISSVNSHIMITNDDIVVLPASVQIIIPIERQLRYCGSDFRSISLSQEIRDRAYSASKSLGAALQHNGYRGICGIDYLPVGDSLLFLEINPRFQGSSFLLDRALHEQFNLSLFDMQRKAFDGASLPLLDMGPLEVERGFCNLELSSPNEVSPKVAVKEINSITGQNYAIFE